MTVMFLTSWIFIILALGAMECNAAQILAFLPMGSHSHQNTYRPIFRELTKRGHNVTYVTSIPDSKAPYKQIVVKDPSFEDIAGIVAKCYQLHVPRYLPNTIDLYEMRKMTWYDDFKILADSMEYTMTNTLSDSEVQKLIHSTDLHFDLVFGEVTLLQYANIAFMHKFQAPFIELSGLCPTFILYDVIGNPYSYSYTVNFQSISSDKMTFMERLRNTIVSATWKIRNHYVIIPKQEELVRKLFRYPGWESRPSLLEMLSNISLVLQNTHVATHYPHAYNPNVIEIAGMQLQEPEKLPQDLQTYMDSAKDGVVYFSLGSIVMGSKMPETTKLAFLSAFEKLPYKVLWKWEAESMPNQPKNVKISKWLPQKDILAHPNLKVFITHGGLASITESIQGDQLKVATIGISEIDHPVYHGTPIILIPIFTDQFKNAKQVEAVGNGLILEFDNITSDSVVWAVNTVISQPSYLKAAKKQSKILRDNPISALDKAVYWTEYVLRHQGAPHLRPATVGLPWYKYYLIDVVAVLLSCTMVCLIAIYFTLRTLYKLICSKSSESASIKFNKKKFN